MSHVCTIKRETWHQSVSHFCTKIGAKAKKKRRTSASVSSLVFECIKVRVYSYIHDPTIHHFRRQQIPGEREYHQIVRKEKRKKCMSNGRSYLNVFLGYSLFHTSSKYEH